MCIGFTTEDLNVIPFGYKLPILSILYNCKESNHEDMSIDTAMFLGRFVVSKSTLSLLLFSFVQCFNNLTAILVSKIAKEVLKVNEDTCALFE